MYGKLLHGKVRQDLLKFHENRHPDPNRKWGNKFKSEKGQILPQKTQRLDRIYHQH